MKKHARRAGQKWWIWSIVFGLLFGFGIGYILEESNRTAHADGTKWNGLCG